MPAYDTRTSKTVGYEIEGKRGKEKKKKKKKTCYKTKSLLQSYILNPSHSSIVLPVLPEDEWGEGFVATVVVVG